MKKLETFLTHKISNISEGVKEVNTENGRKRKKAGMMKFTATAAALVGAFLILPNTSASIAYAMGQIPIIGPLVEVVTFRDYQYETDRNRADIEVPEIEVKGQAEDNEVKEKLERTADEINAEIKKISDEQIEYFEKYLEDEQGYQDIIIKSKVLATTQDYFTLKLICYQGPAVDISGTIIIRWT